MSNTESTPQDNQQKNDSFRKMRFMSRLLLVQLLYRCECYHDWSLPSDEELEDFFSLSRELDDVSDSCFANARKRAIKLLPMLLASVDTLDGLITEAASNWSLKRMSYVDRNILRLGVFEMKSVNNVTPAIAINEAIELAKLMGEHDSPRFINGVLDKIRRSLNRQNHQEQAE